VSAGAPFADRSVIVTGAGQGLGRAYARLLGALGADVVVNDLGCDELGRGSDPALAAGVAREITSEGGRAVPNSDDVRTAESPEDALYEFLQSTYEAAANAARWDRDELECTFGQPGIVRQI